MKILWITQWFPPDLGALPARLTETAREWLAAGHEVTVIAGFPHHPLGVIPPAYRRSWVVEEEFHGIRVVRCWLWALPNRRIWQRSASQLSFALTSLLFGLRRTRASRPDVVIVSSPPFFQVQSGWVFARFHRAPLVFEVRDLWPAVFLEAGMLKKGLVYRSLEAWERALYRAAARVVVVTRSFRDDLVARGVPVAKVAFVPNGADPDFFRPMPPDPELRAELGGAGKFLVTFVGTHGLATGLEQVLDAAEILRGDEGIAFALVGEGARRDELIAEASRRGLSNVTFRRAVPKDRMPAVYAASDVCLVCLRPLDLFDKFVPSKIFEILACGRPLVAALSGEAAQLVARAGGVVVPPGDGEAIAREVVRVRAEPILRADMATRARELVRSEFDRRGLAHRYAEILREVVAAWGPPTTEPRPLAGTRVALVSRCAWTLFNFRRGLIAALLEGGSEVLAGGDGTDGFGARVEELGARFVPLPVDRRPISITGDLRLLVALFRWYRRERPDLVHHFTIKPVIYGSIAARLAGVPRIVNTVTGLGHAFLRQDGGLLRRLVERLYWVAFKCAHFTFFLNREDRDLFVSRGLVVEERTGLLPGDGVDCVHFRPPEPRSGAGAEVRILMMARLLKEKGIYEFVEAARQVMRVHPEARFELLGRRDERNPSVVSERELTEWQAEGVVDWLGEVADVRPALASADVVVLPSYREGTPRSLLEAAAMGKPIVTTDAVGCREVVDDGHSGLLVPVGDAGALAEAVIRLIEDPDLRHRMGMAGRAKMERQFDERAVLELTLAAYQPAMARRSRLGQAAR